MRRSTLTTALVAVVAACTSLPAAAQRSAAAPKRPKLPALADTNEARNYLDLGVRLADASPAEAATAFYWASRIDPGLSDALYGRRIALLLEDDNLLGKYMADRDRDSKAQRALDSLQLRAVMLNPFLYRRLDVTLLTSYYRRSIQRGTERSGSAQPSSNEIDFAIETWLTQSGPYMRGWMAYGRTDFRAALAYYADALKRTKEKAGLRVERGRIFAMQGQADSAIAEFRLALAEQRKADAKDVVVLYNSKAVLEQGIGLLLEQQDSVAAAREAYGRALQEDLAIGPRTCASACSPSWRRTPRRR